MIEFAFGPDRAAVGQDDVFCDRQPQTGAAGFAGTGFIHPIKALKQALKVFGGDARPKILNIEFDRLGAGRAPTTIRPPAAPYFSAFSTRLEKT